MGDVERVLIKAQRRLAGDVIRFVVKFALIAAAVLCAIDMTALLYFALLVAGVLLGLGATYLTLRKLEAK